MHKAMNDDTESTLIANETRKNVKDCHGVSIYFPYSVREEREISKLRDCWATAETGIVNLPLVKGGPDNATKGTQWENCGT